LGAPEAFLGRARADRVPEPRDWLALSARGQSGSKLPHSKRCAGSKRSEPRGGCGMRPAVLPGLPAAKQAGSVGWLAAIVPTWDGGYLPGGVSSSQRNDQFGGNKTAPNHGEGDMWLVKVDRAFKKVWDQSYGGPGAESVSAAITVGSDGVLLVGNSDSPAGPGKSAPFLGRNDCWVVRTGPWHRRLPVQLFWTFGLRALGGGIQLRQTKQRAYVFWC
jgi:hypothetical protein